ncbi:MAG: OsmC family protein, partial [Bacteroidetes bacterium]
LRFDFTGLGESEGDFADTNFTTNVADLEAAANYLTAQYQAPSLLIGHSLGGAAVLHVADKLPSVKAVATIGAPYNPAHVKHLLVEGEEEIARKGEAVITIGGRPFNIKQQFLDDLADLRHAQKIEHLGRALLILHSPQDLTVTIDNAAAIYHAARHPKSFISLDGSDHLLSGKMDAEYAGEVIACWVKRYLDLPKPESLRTEREVAVRLGREGFTTEVMVRHHSLIADEPPEVGGNDLGPSPYELLSAALGACTAMTMQMYARRKKWPLEEVVVHLDHRKDYVTDQGKLHQANSKIDLFDRIIEMSGPLDETQQARLLEIADRCPVHRTLHADVQVNTILKK